MEKIVKESKYDKLANEIEWGNWIHNEGEQNEKYWQISEVLYCRLDWLKEQLESNTLEKDEALQTIEMLQVFVSGIKDEQLKKENAI